VSKFFGAGMNVLAWFERAFVLIFFSLYFGWHDQSTDGAYARPFMICLAVLWVAQLTFKALADRDEKDVRN